MCCIYSILLLRQHGLGQYLEEKYKTYSTSRCAAIDEQAVRKRDYNGPLTIHQMKGVFFVLKIGLSLSSLAFIAELFVARWKRYMTK